MIFAQLKNGIIVNTIVVDDTSLLYLFEDDPATGEPYDALFQIDAVFPRPGIGWSYDNVQFVAPPPPPEEEA